MSDAYLLDTSIASPAWDAGNANYGAVQARLAGLSADAIFVCSVTLAEVEYGLQISQGMDAGRRQAVRSAMREYQVLSIDHHTSEPYGVIRGALFEQYASRDRRGRITQKRPEELRDRTTARELGIQENDLWIVSVAAQYDLVLLTQDGRMQRILDVAATTLYPVRAEIWTFAAPPGETKPTTS